MRLDLSFLLGCATTAFLEFARRDPEGRPPDKQAKAIDTVLEQAEQLGFEFAAEVEGESRGCG